MKREVEEGLGPVRRNCWSLAPPWLCDMSHSSKEEASATLLKQHGSIARPEGTQYDQDNNPSGRFCRFRQQRGLIACMGVSAIQVGSAASATCTYLPQLRRASAQKVAQQKNRATCSWRSTWRVFVIAWVSTIAGIA